MKMLKDIISGYKSWADLYNELCKENSSSGKLFEEFCKYYYLVEPSVCNEYRHVWLFPEIPPKVREKLNLTTIDHGIDLVLEDYEGNYSAIQCKFRNNQNAILSWSKDKITNIFAEGDKADYFIVFTNASGLDKHTLTKKQNRLKLVGLGDLLEISSDTFANIENLSSKKQSHIQEKKPRDYQKQAIDAVVNGFKTTNRGQLILPCGVGKTLISLWIQQALDVRRTIVLVPSLALLRQTKKEWSANGQKLPYLCVCSEKDIDGGLDNVITHAYEIPGNVTTDPKDIRNFLKNHKQLIIYSTYQSLDAIQKAVNLSRFKFDLAICDEAHKTAGSKVGAFSIIHDDTKISISKRLYMTATPRIVSKATKSKLGEQDLKYLCDMSDQEIFGHELFRMSFKEAIDQNILIDYQIVAVGVSDRELEQAIKQRKYVDNNVTIDEVANNYALDKFMKKYKAKHAITFHSSVAKAKAFKERHHDIYHNVDAYHVNGLMTTNSRSTFMKEFEISKKSIMTNARCLTEGIDVPAIDVVFFGDPKNSKIDIVQAAGRAMRRADEVGKKLGFIVVPIFHRDKEKLDEIIEKGPFKNLISVIKALSSQDERLQEEIRSFKLGKGIRNNNVERGNLQIEKSFGLLTMVGFEEKLDKCLFNQVIEKTPIPFREFYQARSAVRDLNLKNQSEWIKYSQSGKKPDDIPTNPDKYYKNMGWVSMGDWLGTGTIADKYKIYLPFHQAREYVHSLNLKSRAEWIKYCHSGNKPENIPAAPHRTYKATGWISMGDWLNTGVIATKNRIYLSFHQAREYVHTLSLKNRDEWRKYYQSERRPQYIPSNPESVYKNQGWVSMGDWLGTGTIAARDRKYLTFSRARAFVHDLDLKNRDEWIKYCHSGNKPDDIPVTPHQTYKNQGWVSMGDWLGTNRISTRDRKYRQFDLAREFAISLQLENVAQWKKYCKSGKLPDDIPHKPEHVYKKQGWISFGNWLGTGAVACKNMKYLPFNQAREYVHGLNLKNRKEWKIYCKSEKKPDSIPANPDQAYKTEGWISMGDWLGSGYIANRNRKYLSFNQARSFVQSLNLKSEKEWRIYCKSGNKPNTIPSTPAKTYKNHGWVSMGDWLGNGNIATQTQKFLPFDQARRYVHNLKLNNWNEWLAYAKSKARPNNIPSNPNKAYKNGGWLSCYDWLGTKTRPT